MAKEKCTSKLQSVTTELFNNYYEDASVTKRKIANNASSKVKGNSVSKQKAVLSSKPQKKVNNLKNQNGNKIIITNSLKQTASFLNNHQRYLQEFPTLGQSYKSQTVPKPQQQQLNKQSSKISNKSFAPKTYKSPATYTAKQTEELLRQFYALCQSYNAVTYFGNESYQTNTWSKNSNGQWISSSSAIALRNAPVVSRNKIQQSYSRQTSTKKQSIQQQMRQQPIRQINKQSEVNLNNEFSDICQCYDGMNYFGKSVYQNNTWSKNRSGNWVSSSTSFSVKNAPVVVRSSKIQQSSRKVSSSRNQPVRQMSRQQYIVNFNSEFSDLCQCYDGMNYFGKSSFQKNTWTINRSGKWVSSSTSFSMKNAPVVIRSSKQQQITRQASVKKQTTQQSRKLKKQQRSMPVVNSAITKEQQQMNQKSIVAQQNASLKLQSKVLKQFKEKQEQLEKKKKLEEQQKEMKQEQMRIQQKKNAERKLKEQQAAKQSIKKNVKQAQSIKKQQLQKNKIRNQKINAPVRKMTKGQEKKMRKRQHLINLVNKRIQELVAEKQQKQLFSQMVKQKAQQILEEKHEASIQKSMQNYKKTQSNKLLEKETYEKQQKSVQKKLAKQKMQIRNKINNKSSSLETQKSKQLKELKSKLTPEQFSKIQSILQQNNNNSKEQNARQLQSEQDKKNWQEQVRKMKERQQEIQQKQRRQSLIKKRFESIKRKLTPKQQINLMNNLKLKQQQKENKSNNSKVNNKKQQVVQKPTKKQTIMKQQKVNMNKNQVWTFVNNNKTQQKPIQKSKGTKQWKTVSSRPLNPSETMMFNKEFAELCNAFESTNYVTYSNYKTWSMNKSGKYVSNASIISARNAPRNTKGGLSKQLNFSGKSSVSMAQKNKPQQVRNIKNNKSRY